jgi:hypothetical protein
MSWSRRVESTELSDTTQWLEWMFTATPPGLIWIGGHGDGFKGRTFANIDEAAAYAARLDEQRAGGVYFRLTPLARVPERRGAAADSSHLIAFGADLDLAGPGHKAAKLPRPASEADLRSILDDAGIPEPTAWVHSGGGRYGFWKLDEPLALTDGATLEWAETVSGALHAKIIDTAAERGLKIDNTRDLARVYRLPGTHNLKGEMPFVAAVLDSSGPRYERHAFAEQVDRTRLNSIELDETPQVSAPSTLFSSSLLFGDPAPRRDEPKLFTVDQAMARADEWLGRLRAAQDGEINNTLRDAALQLAHFGPEFWDRATAETKLHEALTHTEYDGRTWQAQATIDGAYRDMVTKANLDGTGEFWHAVLVPDLAEQSEIIKAAATADDAVAKMMAKLLDRDQLEALPDPEPLVQDLLDLDSESWIIGASGGFKSFVALDIACHVARGMPWRGKPVKRGEVIYIVAEGSKGIRKRIQAWEKTYGGRADGVFVLPEPVQSASRGAKAGVGPEWLTLVEVVRRRRPVMVVIDTQARVTVGLNENDNGEMNVFVMAVTLMRQAAGSCVLVVHHTGRNGGDARGASAIDAAQDTELKVSRPESASKRAELTAVITLDKQKDGEDSAKIEIQLKVVTLGQNQHTGKVMTSLAIEPGDAWASSALKLPPVPDWRLALDGVKAEVVTVMEDHAGDNGATQAEIIRWITERRRERDDARPVAKSGVSSAVKNLCGEYRNVDGSFSTQVMERHGVRLIMCAE